jgi:hypothetical protein
MGSAGGSAKSLNASESCERPPNYSKASAGRFQTDSLGECRRTAVGQHGRLYLHRVLALTSVWPCAAGGCSLLNPAHTAMPVAPPLPESFLSRDFLNLYYPDFSRRNWETGEVILHLTVASNGVVQLPAFGALMSEQTSAPPPLLVNAAMKLVKGAQFPVGDTYRSSLTMSIVFELTPCGRLPHSSGVDYGLNLCAERPPDLVFSDPPLPRSVYIAAVAADATLSADEQSVARSQLKGYDVACSCHLWKSTVQMNCGSG